MANQIDINALLAAIQPQIQALVGQAIQQAMGVSVAPVPALPSTVVIAPPAATAPQMPMQITLGSTIAHIQPIIDIVNPLLMRLLPPPYNLIPQGLGALAHLISGASGTTPISPASLGQALDATVQSMVGGAQAGGIKLPPWLQAIDTALHPVAAPTKAATAP